MRIVPTISLLLGTLLSTSNAGSQGVTENCTLTPVVFPGDSFYRQVSSVVTLPPLPDNMTLRKAVFSFSPPRTDSRFEHDVVDTALDMKFDASAIVSQWENEVRRRLTDNGCSKQNVHSFRAEPGADGVLRGYYHVKYVRRWCAFGGTGDLGVIETDVWNTFSLNVDQNGHVKLDMQGHATDNVTDLERDAAKIIGNLFALCPLTSSLVLGLDTQIFGALEAERDAMEELSRVVTLYQWDGKSDTEDEEAYPFLVKKALFERMPDGRIGLHVTSVLGDADSISVSQACKLRGRMSQQLLQAVNIGPIGTTYVAQRGDSLWSIAQRFYGDGHYFHLIGSDRGRADARIVADQKLAIPSVGSVLHDPQYILVKRKQTAWTIAKANSSRPDALKRLIVANKVALRKPRTIYPLQILKKPD